MQNQKSFLYTSKKIEWQSGGSLAQNSSWTETTLLTTLVVLVSGNSRKKYNTEPEYNFSIELFQSVICHQRCFSDDTLAVLRLFSCMLLLSGSGSNRRPKMYSLQLMLVIISSTNIFFTFAVVWKEALAIWKVLFKSILPDRVKSVTVTFGDRVLMAFDQYCKCWDETERSIFGCRRSVSSSPCINENGKRY